MTRSRFLGVAGSALGTMVVVAGLATTSDSFEGAPALLSLPETGAYCAGDADFSQEVDLGDVMYLVDYIFRHREQPRPFYLQGDADCSGRISAADVITLVNYWFRGGQICEFCGRYFKDTSGMAEAELMALWYSDELTAPLDLAVRFKDDLRRVRTELSAQVPSLDGIFFRPPWTPSLIMLGVDSVTAQAIRDSLYVAWDSLNESFGQDSLWEYLDFGYEAYFRLRFSGLKNPNVISASYEGLPGVLYAYPPGHAGEEPAEIWPYQTGDTVTYLFKAAWGDCQAGCGHKRFIFVGATDDTTWLIGEWSRTSGQGDGPPPWWDQACRNLSRIYLSFLCP
jgi:hypothetical protein